MGLFKKATKEQLKLRMALIGPSGSGKTYTALTLATAGGGKIAMIDTERGSGRVYADKFSFDVIELTSYEPQRFIEAINAAGDEGYDWLVIDSLSHAWMGKGGVLEFVDKTAKRQSGNSFGAWREATPLHNELVDTMLGSPCHIIVTMRAKMEYVQEKGERTGKTTVRKIGLQPVQREGLEYEFYVVGDMDVDNNLIVTKTRCPSLTGAVINKPGAELTDTLLEWLNAGEPAPPPLECADCGEPIRARKLGNRDLTADQIIEISIRKYEHALCGSCLYKRDTEKKTESATAQGAQA